MSRGQQLLLQGAGPWNCMEENMRECPGMAKDRGEEPQGLRAPTRKAKGSGRQSPSSWHSLCEVGQRRPWHRNLLRVMSKSEMIWREREKQAWARAWTQ